MTDYQDHQSTEGLAILDCGSQYTLLIAKTLREQGIYSEVFPHHQATPVSSRFKGIILSGGPQSAGAPGAPIFPAWLQEDLRPILGICYGMQLLVLQHGGSLRQSQQREYGSATVQWSDSSVETLPEHIQQFCQGLWGTSQQVWMSHGDDAGALGNDLQVLARTDAAVIAALAHKSLPRFGIQFHPEVQHTVDGYLLLQNFARKVCGLRTVWTAKEMLAFAEKSLVDTLGSAAERAKLRVLVAVSGGVDSTVLASFLGQHFTPEQLCCVLVDHGFLREREAELVTQSLREQGIQLQVLQAQESFLQCVQGLTDSEAKRKAVGRQFIQCFEEFAQKEGPFTHLAQGTLYPDVIESAHGGAGATVIKSHHNVGGLPETLGLKLLEPFRFMFKDEVRSIGRGLGLSAALVDRHPFPGPGLSIRIPGAVDLEKLTILRKADAIYMQELRDAGLYAGIWQAGCVLLSVKSVGVMGDHRTYEWTLVLRAVSSVDGMTAHAIPLPYDFLALVSTKIINQVPGINRVLYDVTSKPPATIEWE